MNSKLTQTSFENLSNFEKTQEYFSDEGHMVIGKNRSKGPSFTSQYRFWMNWQSAFAVFKDSLPLH